MNKVNNKILEEYIQEGKIRSELDELCSKLLKTKFYSGLTIDFNQTTPRISILVADPNEVIGENKFFLKQFQNMICQRFNWEKDSIILIFEKIVDKRLVPAVYAEQIRQLCIDQKPYRKVIMQAFRNVKIAGGQGVCITIAGKVKGQRAKVTRYRKDLLIKAGQPAKIYTTEARTEAKCNQGVIGIHVVIMLPYDSEGVRGPNTILPDKITIFDPKTVN